MEEKELTTIDFLLRMKEKLNDKAAKLIKELDEVRGAQETINRIIQLKLKEQFKEETNEVKTKPKDTCDDDHETIAEAEWETIDARTLRAKCSRCGFETVWTYKKCPQCHATMSAPGRALYEYKEEK